jgi:hypothetical protein
MPILSGTATSSGSTIITIPAGEIWQGSLSVSLGTDNNNSSLSISVSGGGTGVSPAAGTVLLATCAKVPALGLANTWANVNTSYVQAGDADATLVATYSGSGSPVLRASANGAY